MSRARSRQGAEGDVPACRSALATHRAALVLVDPELLDHADLELATAQRFEERLAVAPPGRHVERANPQALQGRLPLATTA
eukprot:11164952-Lingulodinium_polyedra.AAC.1